MEIRVCPECKKAFYAPNDSESLSCPHCGYIFIDRRSKGRLHKDIKLVFSINGKKIPAKLRDYSDGGARVVYKGRALRANDTLELEIEKLKIRRTAKAVWSIKLSSSLSSTGLKFL